MNEESRSASWTIEHRTVEVTTTLSDLADARYVSLTTFRRTRERVSTPVWTAPDHDNHDILYMLTMVGAGKLKRIRNDQAVEVARCNYRGDVRGPSVPAVARVLPQAEHGVAERALTRKYGWQKRALDLYHFLTRGRRTYVVLSV